MVANENFVFCVFGFLGSLVSLAVWSRDERITWQTVVIAIIGGTVSGGYGISMIHLYIDFPEESKNLWAAFSGFCALWVWIGAGKTMKKIQESPTNFLVKLLKHLLRNEDSSKTDGGNTGANSAFCAWRVGIDRLVF